MRRWAPVAAVLAAQQFAPVGSASSVAVTAAVAPEQAGPEGSAMAAVAAAAVVEAEAEAEGAEEAAMVATTPSARAVRHRTGRRTVWAHAPRVKVRQEVAQPATRA